jgi:hypothetical protein
MRRKLYAPDAKLHDFKAERVCGRYKSSTAASSAEKKVADFGTSNITRKSAFTS